MGQVEVGGNKCALRDHSEVPGVMGMRLIPEALDGGKVGERDMEHLDTLPPVSHRGFNHMGWVGTGPSFLHLSGLAWHIFGLS